MDIHRLKELAGIKALFEMSLPAATAVFSKYGVTPDASPEGLKKQFRGLAQKYHPDLGGDAEAMKEINAAYEILKASVSNDEEDMRREHPGGMEDFSDIDYARRRLKKASGPGAQMASVVAFNGREFTASLPVEISPQGYYMATEIMMAHNPGHYTKAVCVIYKNDPKKMVVVHADRGGRITNPNEIVTMSPMSWGNDITKDKAAIQRLIQLTS